MSTHFNKVDQLIANVAHLQSSVDQLAARLTASEEQVAHNDKIKRKEIAEVAKRLRRFDRTLAELQEFMWPVLNKLFPSLLLEYEKVRVRFMGTDPLDNDPPP
jgi:hypothetical protein